MLRQAEIVKKITFEFYIDKIVFSVYNDSIKKGDKKMKILMFIVCVSIYACIMIKVYAQAKKDNDYLRKINRLKERIDK